MDTDFAQLTLALNDYDADEKGDFLGFDIAVRSNGYAAAAPFWVSRRDIDTFMAALADLDSTLRGSAELVCGYVDEETVRLCFKPWGRSGRLLVSAKLAAESNHEGTRRNALVEFILLPNALSAFRRELSALIAAREPGEAVLLQDHEAAG